MVMEATYEVAANRSLFVISHRCLYSRHHQHHNDGRSLLNLQVISDRMLLSTASDKTLPAETNRSRTLHWIRIILLHWRYAYNFLLWLTIVVALAIEIIPQGLRRSFCSSLLLASCRFVPRNRAEVIPSLPLVFDAARPITDVLFICTFGTRAAAATPAYRRLATPNSHFKRFVLGEWTQRAANSFRPDWGSRIFF